jgi:hypothetical protein
MKRLSHTLYMTMLALVILLTGCNMNGDKAGQGKKNQVRRMDVNRVRNMDINQDG